MNSPSCEFQINSLCSRSSKYRKPIFDRRRPSNMEKSNAFVSYRKLIILVGEGAFFLSAGRDLKKMQNERYRQRVSMKSSPSIRKTSCLNPGSIHSFVCCRTTLFNTLFTQLVRTRSILNLMIQTAPVMIVILRKKSLQ